MAEGADDKESKTEEATEKQISDSLKKGNFPVARDAIIVALLLSIAVYLKFFGPAVASSVTERLAYLWDHADEIRLINSEDVKIVFQDVGTIVFDCVRAVAGHNHGYWCWGEYVSSPAGVLSGQDNA